MTSHTGRLYALAFALVAFFLAWAVVAAHPWATRRQRPAPAGARRAGGAAAPRGEAREPGRRAALGPLPERSSRRAGRRSPPRRPAPPRARVVLGERCARVGVGARRDAAAADDHEDVVIERRTFRAMGTEIELLVEADGAAAALDAAEHEFHRLEALLSRFREDSELSRLNRDGSLAAGPDLLPRRRARARRARPHRRPLRPDRPRRARRRRLRPLLRGHRPGEPRPVPGTGRGRRGRARRSDTRIELDARRPARPRRHRQGLRGRAGGGDPRDGAGRASSTRAATSPSAADAGRSASRPRPSR